MKSRQFKTELYDQLARVGNALANGWRLELIDLLAQGERTVESLAKETEQPIANVSQHLQVLRRSRLVESRRAGTYIFYRLASNPVVPMKKSIPGKTPKEAVSEKSGSSSGDNGFRGLLEGRFGADGPLGDNVVLGWTQMDVYF